MAIRVVRLGSARGKDEGPRIGTVRRPPRGVRKTDYSKLDYYDVWLPQLSPSPDLVKAAQQRPDVDFLGLEVAQKYARFSAAALAKRGLTNAVVIAADALRVFADNSHVPRAVMAYLDDSVAAG